MTDNGDKSNLIKNTGLKFIIISSGHLKSPKEAAANLSWEFPVTYHNIILFMQFVLE